MIRMNGICVCVAVVLQHFLFAVVSVVPVIIDLKLSLDIVTIIGIFVYQRKF